MRIIAGAWGGRRLTTPRGTLTRPTSDRVREALFDRLSSLLGSNLGEASALDAFAGSGALGLEALSRGASHVTFAERDPRALAALRKNLAALHAGARSVVLVADAFALVRTPVLGSPFSLLLLDPPYRIPSADVGRLVGELAVAGALAAGCVVTWEHPRRTEPSWPKEFRAISVKRYGDIGVDIAEYVTGATTT